MKLYKVVQKANALMWFDYFPAMKALMTVLMEHGLKIKGRDEDYYFIGNRKHTGIITINGGQWQY